MGAAIVDLPTLVAAMSPTLDARTVAFVSVGDELAAIAALPAGTLIATFREGEGTTLIVEAKAAERASLPILFRAAWITLAVHSDLQAVGLTAVVAGALAAAGVSCNVVAAAFHDHLFVPLDKAQLALEVLRRLQRDTAQACGA